MPLADDDEGDVHRDVVEQLLDEISPFLLPALELEVEIIDVHLPLARALLLGRRGERIGDVSGSLAIVVEHVVSPVDAQLDRWELAAPDDVVLGFADAISVEEHVLGKPAAAILGRPVEQALFDHLGQVDDVFLAIALQPHGAREVHEPRICAADNGRDRGASRGCSGR